MQLLLPFPHLRVPERHIEWLKVANAGDYSDKKVWFYPFKNRFMHNHATPDGLDLQTIIKKCWCGDGIWRGMDDQLPSHLWQRCDRCAGTAIYLKKKIVLLRWLVRGEVFHVPSTWLAHAEYVPGTIYKNQFEGLIKHAEVPPSAARRAMEKLLLRYEPRWFYEMWMSRWRYWQWQRTQAAKRLVSRQIRHVNALLARAPQEEEIPF